MARAQEVREARELQETRRELQVASIEESNRQHASRVKAETSFSVTDESKRFFFSQRKAAATDVLKEKQRLKQARSKSPPAPLFDFEEIFSAGA